MIMFIKDLKLHSKEHCIITYDQPVLSNGVNIAHDTGFNDHSWATQYFFIILMIDCYCFSQYIIEFLLRPLQSMSTAGSM